MSAAVAGFIHHDTGKWYFACNENGLLQVSHSPILDTPELNDYPLVTQHARALLSMLNGEVDNYPLPMVIEGTEFQRKVWRAIAAVGFGEVVSYSEIAKQLGRAARAVGTACGANKLGIAIPCHRVIRSDGEFGGYGLGGLKIKQRLLDYERNSKGKLAA